ATALGRSLAAAPAALACAVAAGIPAAAVSALAVARLTIAWLAVAVGIAPAAAAAAVAVAAVAAWFAAPRWLRSNHHCWRGCWRWLGRCFGKSEQTLDPGKEALLLGRRGHASVWCRGGLDRRCGRCGRGAGSRPLLPSARWTGRAFGARLGMWSRCIGQHALD